MGEYDSLRVSTSISVPLSEELRHDSGPIAAGPRRQILELTSWQAASQRSPSRRCGPDDGSRISTARHADIHRSFDFCLHRVGPHFEWG
jgi:hypothetical protein